MKKDKQQLKEREKETRRFLEKIVINAGIGGLSQQPNFSEEGAVSDRQSPQPEKGRKKETGETKKKSVLSQIIKDLAAIAGQQPETRKARKSIAGFKTREGQIVGLRVTLRKRKMVDFFERLIKIVLPRVRDFRGLELKSIDEGGILNIGFREQLTFPEIDPETTQVIFSLGVNLVPRKKNRASATAEYRRLGVPLKNG